MSTIPSPNSITELKPNQIFVFGSNEGGRHGRGAALAAVAHGARHGQGSGLSGQTWGIPTKDADLKVLPLSRIAEYINDFIVFAIAHPEMEFLVTRIGCGLARYTPIQIAPLFITAKYTPNILLPQDFMDILQTCEDAHA